MTVEVLADYIVQKCIDDGQKITDMRLQNILYYIQKSYLKKGKPAFEDDFFTWRFGPAIPSVFYKYAGSGAEPIDVSYGIDTSSIGMREKKKIDPIIEKVRELKPWDISKDILNGRSAWKSSFGFLGHEERDKNIIDKADIKAERSYILDPTKRKPSEAVKNTKVQEKPDYMYFDDDDTEGTSDDGYYKEYSSKN